MRQDCADYPDEGHCRYSLHKCSNSASSLTAGQCQTQWCSTHISLSLHNYSLNLELSSLIRKNKAPWICVDRLSVLCRGALFLLLHETSRNSGIKLVWRYSIQHLPTNRERKITAGLKTSTLLPQRVVVVVGWLVVFPAFHSVQKFRPLAACSNDHNKSTCCVYSSMSSK